MKDSNITDSYKKLGDVEAQTTEKESCVSAKPPPAPAMNGRGAPTTEALKQTATEDGIDNSLLQQCDLSTVVPLPPPAIVDMELLPPPRHAHSIQTRRSNSCSNSRVI